MAGLSSSDSVRHGMLNSVIEESSDYKSKWFFSRKEIEENSPSRRDAIDLKKENYLRKSYCTFLQDLGMKLKVPQVTIATAIVFCHRFFLRQSHAKNDRKTIATVCMFLAGKVEETPRPLKDVILVSYEIIHKKDHAAIQKIKLKEVYDLQKELVLLGERVVLATLGFDLNVQHPYKPLVEAIKKFKVAQNALAQVAWNFVNDGLRTSLCLQFKPHHIAAGAIFLAAKFLKVKLPSDGERVWWQEFDVTPRQLEEVSNQMLELYEQNRALQLAHVSEAEGNIGKHHPTTTTTATENPMSSSKLPQAGGVSNMKLGPHGPPRSWPVQNQVIENGSGDIKSDVSDQNMDAGHKDRLTSGAEPHSLEGDNMTEAEASSSNKSLLLRPVDNLLVNNDESTRSKSRGEAADVTQNLESGQQSYAGRNFESRAMGADEKSHSQHLVGHVGNAEEGELSSLEESNFHTDKRGPESTVIWSHQDHSATEVPGLGGRINYCKNVPADFSLERKAYDKDCAIRGRPFEGKELEFSHKRDLSMVNRVEYAERELKRQPHC